MSCTRYVDSDKDSIAAQCRVYQSRLTAWWASGSLRWKDNKNTDVHSGFGIVTNNHIVVVSSLST